MASRSARVSAPIAVLAVATSLALVAPAPLAFAATPPSAPRSVVARPGNQAVTVTWTAPSSTGGARIDAYRVTWWKSGTTTKHAVKLRAAARSLVQKSLANGTKYVFQVAAHNSRGWGKASAQRTAVPRTIPGAPTNIAGTPGFDQISLTWGAAASNGAAIGKYGLRMSMDGGQDWQPAPTSGGTDEVTTRAAVVQAPRNTLWDGNVHPYLLQVRAHNVAGWGPWASAHPASGVAEQTPVFVPGNTVGDAAAAALRDELTGSYWEDGYPTAAVAGTWHEGEPWVDPVVPVCSSPTMACTDGTPQSPDPSFNFDFTAQPGDTDRRVVNNVTGGNRFDITYRARVTTSAPVAFSASGLDCTFEIDSTQGNVPDLTLAVPINFPGVGWQQKAVVGTVTVTNLEAQDINIQPLVCQGGNFGSSYFLGAIQQSLQNDITRRVSSGGTTGCGTDAPFYWQPCDTVLDVPFATPPSVPAASKCPTAPPAAGPYLKLTCDGSTLVRTCADGWADVDGQIADGCERSTDGFVPAQVDATTAQALADHLSGSFSLGGYPGGVGTGTVFAAPNPVRVPLRSCIYSPTFGCPQTVQQPLPTLQLDLADHGDFGARRQGVYNETDDYAQLTLRGRVSLTGTVAFMQGDVRCDLQIDTTQGAQPDVAFNVAAFEGNGPLSIVPFDDSSTWTTVVGLEDQDIIVGPNQWCSYNRQHQEDQVRAWVRDTLVAWAQREGALCGAPNPYFWQRCSS